MPTTKPTLLLVPASFAPPIIYSTLLSHTTATNNLSLKILSLPSTTKKPGLLPTIYSDASYIASEVLKLADAGNDVILIGHSYGGIPVSESMKMGLRKTEREKNGKVGGVVRLGYISALVPRVGGSALSVQVEARSEGLVVDEDGWMHQDNPDVTAQLIFSSVPREEGVKWARMFTQHSSVSFTDQLTYAGYKDVPVSWMFCEGDVCVSPEMQSTAIGVIEEASGKKVDVTRVICDHGPVVTAVEETVAWFEKLVGMGGEE